MTYKTRRMLEEENEAMRETLEEARDLIDDAIGIGEGEEDEEASEDDDESDEDET